MRCLFCGKRLALLRKLTDGEFCSSAHRQRFLEEEQKLALARLIEEGNRAGRQWPAPQPHCLAGFRTEQFAANAGSHSPSVRPPTLEHAPHLALVEASRQAVVPRRDALQPPSSAMLPYQPSLAVAYSTGPGGARAEEVLPMPAEFRACAASRETSPTTCCPRAVALATLEVGVPLDLGPNLIRRPKTSVFLKLARPAPPSHESRRESPSLVALPLVFPEAPKTAGTCSGVVSVAEPESFGDRAMFAFRASELRTTGIELGPAPGANLTATGELAGEVGLGPLTLAACEIAARQEAPSFESFEAAARRPAGTLARAASSLSSGSLATLEADPALPATRPAASLESEARRRAAAASLTPAHDVEGRELSPAAADLAGSEPLAPVAAGGPLCPEPAPNFFPVCAVLPASPYSTAVLPAAETAFALHCDSPAGPPVNTLGAVLEAASVPVAAEIPARVAAPETVDPLCHELEAVGSPDAAAVCPGALARVPAEPLASGPPEPRWDLLASEIPADAGTAAPVPPVWQAEPRRESVRRAATPAPVELRRKAVLPVARLETVKWSRTAPGLAGAKSGARPGWSRDSWMGASKFWQKAPADLKWLSVALPAVVLVGMISAVGWLPSKPARTVPAAEASRSSQLREAVGERWGSLRRNIVDRAAVNIQDDFRSGLAEWDGRGNWGKDWQYDPAGFVLTGPLALLRSSRELADYRFEFLGQIDKKSLNWVFRAADLDNYYAMKLVLVKSGPLPKAAIVHYVVIDGKPERAVQKALPMDIRSDTFFRVRMEVRGENFTTSVQDQLVDFWSDNRLREGGVGFFSEKGERARLRWVEVSHQYDTLGRLCALLAPYSIQSGHGSWNSQ